MKDMKYSINSWIFGNVTIEEICESARKIGVDGIDVSGEPDTTDLKRVREAINANGLRCFAINGNFTDESRVVSHSDPKMRETAIIYGKKLVDMATALDCDKVLIVPARVNMAEFFESRKKDWANAVEVLRHIAEYALEKNVYIMLECVNKYEIAQVRSLQDGINMAKEVGLPNVKVIGDTFHMQLEESRGIENAIREAGKENLIHVHLGDNTREVPGRGSINWRAILIALDEIGYDEALSFEPLPKRMTFDEIMAGALTREELEAELSFSLHYLKTLMYGIE